MILIIDSENISPAKTKEQFSEFGYESIVLCKTAEQARLVIEEENNISLIIIASELEDGNGFELCRELKKTPAGKNAYIMMIISSIENKTAIEKAKHSAADNFTVKPFFCNEFQKRFIHYQLNKTVLLVDDDPIIQLMVQGIFKKFNVEVIVSDDGNKAHNLINNMLPTRLVLMDIDLPNKNGIQLVQLIKNKPSWRKTPIVMLTGSSDVSDVKKCLSAGAVDYISKPFKIDDFNSRLKKYLPDEC